MRNVARRHEERGGRDRAEALSAVERSTGAAHASEVYDRVWLDTLLKRAAQRQAAWAAERGDAALRRIELMRLRFAEGLPVREIARKWELPAAEVHREYRQARRDFKRALKEEVAFHHPGATPEEIETECEALLELLR